MTSSFRPPRQRCRNCLRTPTKNPLQHSSLGVPNLAHDLASHLSDPPQRCGRIGCDPELRRRTAARALLTRSCADLRAPSRRCARQMARVAMGVGGWRDFAIGSRRCLLLQSPNFCTGGIVEAAPDVGAAIVIPCPTMAASLSFSSAGARLTRRCQSVRARPAANQAQIADKP